MVDENDMPAPPPEARENEGPAPTNDMSNDDENPSEDFWAALSSDEDDELEAEEAAPPVEEPAAPTPPAPAEPETQVEPIANLPPLKEPEPEAPAQPDIPEEAYSPERLQAASQKWMGDLSSYYSRMMENEDFPTQLMAEPHKVLPGLMAETTRAAVKNAHDMMMDMVPRIAQQMAQQVISAELSKRTFFRKHPELRTHEAQFEPFLAAYRQHPMNQRRSFEEVADEAAVAYAVRNRIQLGARPGAPASAPQSPPPPPPMGVAASVPTPPRDDFWSNFAEQIVEDDF